jgi:hypothetical protein
LAKRGGLGRFIHQGLVISCCLCQKALDDRGFWQFLPPARLADLGRQGCLLLRHLPELRRKDLSESYLIPEGGF